MSSCFLFNSYIPKEHLVVDVQTKGPQPSGPENRRGKCTHQGPWIVQLPEQTQSGQGQGLSGEFKTSTSDAQSPGQIQFHPRNTGCAGSRHRAYPVHQQGYAPGKRSCGRTKSVHPENLLQQVLWNFRWQNQLTCGETVKTHPQLAEEQRDGPPNYHPCTDRPFLLATTTTPPANLPLAVRLHYLSLNGPTSIPLWFTGHLLSNILQDMSDCMREAEQVLLDPFDGERK